MSKKITKDEAIEKLWRKSELSWKLKGKQKNIYDHFKNTQDDISACLISRQFGKSFVLCLIAVEYCIKNPGSIIKYACPQQKMVERIVKPRINEIIVDCPRDLKPSWMTQDKVWSFPNGSEIQVAGCDGGRYDSLRGGSSHMCIVDEAAFVDELETVVFSVLSPTTDTTGGRIFLATTPNDKNPNHDFHKFFIYPMESSGKLLKYTYLDSPLINDADKERIISRYPGRENNVKFKCEYLCIIPNVSESTVIPEFAANEENVVKEYELPDYCDFYVSADVGFHDLTVVLFAYFDYRVNKLIIMDEYVINGPEMTTDKLHREIKHKEELLFNTKHRKLAEPYLRIMDNDLKLINDLSRFYNMNFIPTEKHNKEQAIDTVRRWIEGGNIIIHPRCKNLRYHVKYAQWQTSKSGTFINKFKHLEGSEESGLQKSHADALDALIYLVRNIQSTKNPYPKNYGTTITADTFLSPKWKNDNSEVANFMRKMMNLKK